MEKNEIEELVRSFCHSSLYGPVDTTTQCLHEEVVFLAPDLTTTIRGKFACLDTIRQYQASATTLDFTITELSIESFDGCSIVNLKYQVVYALNDLAHQEEGSEIIVVDKEGDDIRIIWRGIIRVKKIDPIAE